MSKKDFIVLIIQMYVCKIALLWLSWSGCMFLELNIGHLKKKKNQEICFQDLGNRKLKRFKYH